MSEKTKKWFTWSLLALLPGLTGWFIVLTQEQIEQNRSETYKNISQQQKEEYLEMYHEWSQLTIEEKAETPWGSGPYGGPEIRGNLLQNQEERFLADLPELLSSSSDFPKELGDMLYGVGWRSRVEDYHKKIEYREILNVCSVILITTGLIGFVVGCTVWIRERMAAKRIADPTTTSESAEAPSENQEEPTEAAPEKPKKEQTSLFGGKTSSGPVPTASKNELSVSDKKTDEATTPDSAATIVSGHISSDEALFSKKKSAKKTALSKEKAVAVLDEKLDKESELIDDPLLDSLMTPEPVAKELTELSEQMSAIRDFAAEQQSQMKKLQDGYDWTLIKRFCLRIIRCIDNIDDRIKQVGPQKPDTTPLEDIRDELIFALESSGVEPFAPDLKREYRGLEKYAEAVKERQANEDPELTGKIAEVVRAGYQYLIDETDVKIVRCAQVKLYA